MRLPSVGQTFWQNLSSWKRWLRRTWGPESENFHWKSLPRLTKLPDTEDLHKEQQEGRCTFRIPLKTKQCFSIWTATSEALTLWHRMKSYMFQELWAPRFSFQEKSKPVCLEQVRFYSRGWILDEQKVWCFTVSWLLLYAVYSWRCWWYCWMWSWACQKTTGTRDESARVLCVLDAFTHSTYTVGSRP